MRIVVYDIAAKKGGGGETILKQYLEIAAKNPQKEWWFFVSIQDYQQYESDNIHIIFVDTASSSTLKSYCARKKYEVHRLKTALKDINPDEVISLQNMVVPGVKCKQTVYLHQSFQFSPVKYSFLRKNERSLAFRQRIICNIIKLRLKKADKVIVQTQWMKKAVSKWAHYPDDHIVVEMPTITLPRVTSKREKSNNVFFYPANAYLNKNHEVLIQACRILKEKGYTDFTVQFTLQPDANELSKKLFCEAEEFSLPIEFVGHLSKEELVVKYQSEIMLFPSYIETFGLPLLESKSVGGKIIASNLPFSHEILDDYDYADFVDWNDAEGWAEAIHNSLN